AVPRTAGEVQRPTRQGGRGPVRPERARGGRTGDERHARGGRGHRGAAPRLPAEGPPAPRRDGEGGHAWLSATTTRCSPSRGRPPTRRSRAPTASWPSGIIRTATRPPPGPLK